MGLPEKVPGKCWEVLCLNASLKQGQCVERLRIRGWGGELTEGLRGLCCAHPHCLDLGGVMKEVMTLVVGEGQGKEDGMAPTSQMKKTWSCPNARVHVELICLFPSRALQGRAAVCAMTNPSGTSLQALPDSSRATP